MTVGKGKRPRDPNRLAKWIVDRSTSETPEPKTPSDLSAYMAAIGRKGGYWRQATIKDHDEGRAV
jgi:hypothetical protein